MILQNIWKRVVGNDQMNISPSNNFTKMLLAERFHRNRQADFGQLALMG